jgi:hypothetical protein
MRVASVEQLNAFMDWLRQTNQNGRKNIDYFEAKFDSNVIQKAKKNAYTISGGVYSAQYDAIEAQQFEVCLRQFLPYFASTDIDTGILLYKGTIGPGGVVTWSNL